MARRRKSTVEVTGNLRRDRLWAGLRPGESVRIEGTRLRAASWTFVAHVTNTVTGETWVEVVGGRGGDKNVRSFRPEQVFPVGTRDQPSLADAPRLQLD